MLHLRGRGAVRPAQRGQGNRIGAVLATGRAALFRSAVATTFRPSGAALAALAALAAPRCEAKTTCGFPAAALPLGVAPRVQGSGSRGLSAPDNLLPT